MIKVSQDERNELYLEMRKKRIKGKVAAKAIEISPSLLSQYFNHRANMNIENVNNLKKYIEEYEG